MDDTDTIDTGYGASTRDPDLGPEIRRGEDGELQILIHNKHTPIQKPLIYGLGPSEETEGKTIVVRTWALRGPKDIVDIALAKPPKIRTRVIWEGADLEERTAVAEAGHVNAGALVSSDMTEVFPEATMKWLSAWQYLVNTGAVWHADGSVGCFATRMIERGFLAYAPVPINGHHRPVASRHDVRSGAPGSLRWVETMMGPEYAQFIR